MRPPTAPRTVRRLNEVESCSFITDHGKEYVKAELGTEAPGFH
ncbi:hypothetical protein [Halolamina sp.]